MHRIRAGIIGLGEVAQVIHLPILESLADRFTLAAICDVSPTLLAAMGERYRIPHNARHLDFRDLVARDDVDVVFVINSTEYHAECAIAAMEAGKHVLIEKPMCVTIADAEAIVAARDMAGVQVMVGYMRRFAPAFTQAVEEVRKLGQIRYVRVRDIIGFNRLMIDQSSVVIYPDDIPEELKRDRQERSQRMTREAVGDVPKELARAYGLLGGLNSHDLSAMRELLGGVPKRVISAAQWHGGEFLTVLMDYGDFAAYLETGADGQRRFDAHLEVYGQTSSVRVQYDTPYIRHLPTTITISREDGESHSETVTRPTFKDPYTHELETLYDVIVNGAAVKTTPEDSIEDLVLFRDIVEAMKASAIPATT
jgi:predicted dehydrogenase